MKEKLLEEWEKEFTHRGFGGELQLDQFCAVNSSRKEPIIKPESEIVSKHKSFLSKAIDQAYEAGRESVKKELL